MRKRVRQCLLRTIQEFCGPQARWHLLLAPQPSHSAPHTDLRSGSPDTFPGPDPLPTWKPLHWWGKGYCRRKIQGSLYHCLPEKWNKVLVCSGYNLCFNRGSIDMISHSSHTPRILVILGVLMEGHSVLWQDALVWANAHVDFFSSVVFFSWGFVWHDTGSTDQWYTVLYSAGWKSGN